MILRLTKGLQFQPIQNGLKHEKDCGRFSAITRPGLTPESTLVSLAEDIPSLSKDPSLKDIALYTSRRAYPMVIKALGKDKELKDIENYIYMFMSGIRKNIDGEVYTITKPECPYKYGECILDANRDIERVETNDKYGNIYYKLPVNTNNPKRSQWLYVNASAYEKAIKKFKDEYKQFICDHKKTKMMFFYKGQKSKDRPYSNATVPYWNEYELYIMPVSRLGYTDKSAIRLFNVDHLEEIMLKGLGYDVKR